MKHGKLLNIFKDFPGQQKNPVFWDFSRMWQPCRIAKGLW